jgi:sRNA-binding carbon storage regulator CsrA
MLVVSRKDGEAVIIRVRQPDGLLLTARLTLRMIKKGRIQVEFEAPASIELWRDELVNKGLKDGT